MTKEFFKVSISKISFIYLIIILDIQKILDNEMRQLVLKHIRHMINPKLNSFCA